MKDSIIISILGVIQLFISLLYQIFILNIFGTSRVLDIYFASNTINFIIVAASISVMNFAITPILIKYYKKNEKKKLEELFSSLFNILFMCFFLFGLFQYFFAPYILQLILPGFSIADLEIAIQLFRLQAFLSVINILSALLLAMHYTFNFLYRTIIFPLIAQVVQLLFVWIFYKQFGVFALMYGLIISQFITFVLFTFPFIKLYKFKIIFNSELKDASRKIFPLIISSSFSRSNILVDRFFASTLSAGSITLLQYGEKIIQIINEFINKGISLVSLRKFSLEHDNEKEFQRLFLKLYKTIIFIIVPTIFLIIFYLRDALNLVVLSKNLSSSDVDNIYLVSIAFMGIFIGGSLSSTITNAFFAKGLTKLIAKMNIILQILGIGLKIGLFYLIGFWGLPIAFSITSITRSFVLLILYTFYIYNYDKKLLFKYFIKLLFISFLAIFVSKYLIDSSIDLWMVRLFLGPLLFFVIFALLALKFEKDISIIIYNKLKFR